MDETWVRGVGGAAVRVRARPDALAARSLTLDEVANALRAANANTPVGTLDGPRQTLTIQANRQMTRAAEFARIIVATLLTRRTQQHWEVLGGHINAFNPGLQRWLNAHGLALNDPVSAQLLAGELHRQASMLAFVDAFWVISWTFILMIPLVWLLKRKPAESHRADPIAV